MNQRAIRLVTFLLLVTTASAAERKIVITMDDLPVAPPGRVRSIAQAQRITTGILSVFREYDVPAIGFVNEDKLVADGEIDPACAPCSRNTVSRLASSATRFSIPGGASRSVTGRMLFSRATGIAWRLSR